MRGPTVVGSGTFWAEACPRVKGPTGATTELPLVAPAAVEAEKAPPFDSLLQPMPDKPARTNAIHPSVHLVMGVTVASSVPSAHLDKRNSRRITRRVKDLEIR